MPRAIPDRAAQLDLLVGAVRESGRYRSVCEELIRGIGARELAKQPRLKEAVKATRSTLHQVAGAYLGAGIDYGAALEGLRETAQSADSAAWRQACARLMSRHSSTRERLPILEQFYATTLAGLPPIRAVLDIACGLHPLAIAWMPLAPEVEYSACDIYEDMVGFLTEFLALAGCGGRARVADVTRSCPTQKVDLAFILKSLPCLEQLDRSVGLRLLDSVNADHLLVSFPVHSLGGKKKGMAVNYEARFRELVAGRGWTIQRFEFASELAFRITK